MRSSRTYRALVRAATLACGAFAISGPVWAQQASFTVAETGRTFARLQDAVNAIGNSKATIDIAPGRYGQCAVQAAGVIIYRAANPGSVIFDGMTCEGKAALVLRGQGAEVHGIIFQNMRVPDFNGAGIRLESGNLTVSQSWFRDSEQGILTGGDDKITLLIDKSTFTRLGTCEGSGGCAHSVYTGSLGAVRITRSRFEQGRGGHYVKVRAAHVEITSSSFDDSRGQGTNYMIDLPAGASGTISNNWFVQGADKENYSAFIAVGAEQIWHRSDGLKVEGNDARFAPGVKRYSTFVADWSGEMAGIGPNKLDARLTPFEER